MAGLLRDYPRPADIYPSQRELVAHPWKPLPIFDGVAELDLGSAPTQAKRGPNLLDSKTKIVRRIARRIWPFLEFPNRHHVG